MTTPQCPLCGYKGDRLTLVAGDWYKCPNNRCGYAYQAHKPLGL